MVFVADYLSRYLSVRFATKTMIEQQSE